MFVAELIQGPVPDSYSIAQRPIEFWAQVDMLDEDGELFSSFYPVVASASGATVIYTVGLMNSPFLYQGYFGQQYEPRLPAYLDTMDWSMNLDQPDLPKPLSHPPDDPTALVAETGCDDPEDIPFDESTDSDDDPADDPQALTAKTHDRSWSKWHQSPSSHTAAGDMPWRDVDSDFEVDSDFDDPDPRDRFNHHPQTV